MYYFTSQFARRTCQHDLYSLSLTSLKFNYHIQQLLSILTRPTWNNVAQACFIILYKLFFGHMTVQTDKHWFDFTISRYYLVPAIPALWPLLTTPPDPASFQWTVRTDAFLSLSVCPNYTHRLFLNHLYQLERIGQVRYYITNSKICEQVQGKPRGVFPLIN